MALPAALSPAPIASWQVLDLLSHLVDKSLAVYEEDEEDEEGQGRYRLLETVRQYARDQLMESGTGEACRTRHRDHFRALAEEAKPNLSGPEQTRWLDTLESEHDNLRAALEWCLDEEGAQAGLRLAGALWLFWRRRGHLSEGRQRCAAALSRPGVARERTKAQADTLHGAGTLAWMQGDMASARALLEESLAIQREIGNKYGIAIALNNLGLVASDQGDTASARVLFEESLATMRELGDKSGISLPLAGLAGVALKQGDTVAAQAFIEESLAIERELGNKQGLAGSLNSLGQPPLVGPIGSLVSNDFCPSGDSADQRPANS